MKTIRNSKTGEIKRLHDEGVHKLVSNTYMGWGYVPKSEWKLATRKPKNDQATDQANDQVAEKVKSKKQLKKQLKKKLKKSKNNSVPAQKTF